MFHFVSSGEGVSKSGSKMLRSQWGNFRNKGDLSNAETLSPRPPEPDLAEYHRDNALPW